MKAVVWTRYGSPDSLILQKVEMPVPAEDEILVRIHATTVTAGDCEMRRLELPLMLSFPVRLYAGILKPKRLTILGQELAGEVEEVGSRVTEYRKGDQVFGTTGFRFGGYAEYICLPAEPDDAQGVLAPKPTNLSYEESAAVPTAGLEALHYIRNANLQPGESVMIIGAGGSIGTFSIQLAKHFGAEVTAVDSTTKLDLMRSLGADRVIDYTKQDYMSDDGSYDLIIDVVGGRSVVQRMKLLKQGGIYYLAYAGLSHVLLALWNSLTGGKKLSIQSATQKKEDLDFLRELIEAGELKTVIGRTFPLEQVAEAHRYVEGGGKLGNVAIKVD